MVETNVFLCSFSCSDCQEFTPHWRTVGDALYDEIIIADFDCAYETKICHSFAVTKYPTFIWLEDGEVIDMIPQETSAHALIDYGLKQISKRRSSKRSKREVGSDSGEASETVPMIIGSDAFQSTIASGATLATFCMDWCHHCQFVFKQMSKLIPRFKNDHQVKIVKLNCALDDNYDVCYKELCNGVPTTSLYVNGKRVVEDYQCDTVDEHEDMVRSNLDCDPVKIEEWNERELARKKARKAAKAKAKKAAKAAKA